MFSRKSNLFKKFFHPCTLGIDIYVDFIAIFMILATVSLNKKVQFKFDPDYKQQQKTKTCFKAAKRSFIFLEIKIC